MKKALAALERAQDRLSALVSSVEDIPRAVLAARGSVLQAAVDEAQAVVDALEVRADDSITIPASMSLEELWSDAVLDARQALVKTMLGTIEVSRGRSPAAERMQVAA